MRADDVRLDSAKPKCSVLRRHLLDGVLPETLGLGFLAIIFCGFAATYLIAEHACEQQSVAAGQSQTKALAQVLAGTLGSLTELDEQTLQDLWKQWLRPPQVRSLQWTSPQGQVRFAWPPRAAAVSSLPAAESAAAPPGDDGSRLMVATAAVRTPAGEPVGTLRVATSGLATNDYQTELFWNWGLAAATALLVFSAVYRRLRHHLRPVAAVQRSLQSYADGIEKELLALTLSDSLGNVARGWNLLIKQLAESQQRLQDSQEAHHPQDILARFESAVFRRVVDRLPFGVLCVAGDQHISYANASAAALLGRPAEELVGHLLGDVVDDPTVTQVLVASQGRPGVSRSIDHTRQEGEEETNLRFGILPISEQPAGSEILITIEDIGQLREGQRARDNFLYHVTHELRTPLTSIRAYAETLTKPGFDDERTRKECYNVIISETRRLASLIDNILSISQLEVGTARLEIGEVDLLRLMRQMVQDNLGTADEKHIDLTLALPPKVPRIHGDKQRLSVLLTNLIGNAIKYTPENGAVGVALEASDHHVAITVRDNGIGIAPQDQPHVFDKFYRSDHESVQTVPGTGLGLAIAREVARLHGGDLRLESDLGKGSTFTVELPLPATDHMEVTPR